MDNKKYKYKSVANDEPKSSGSSNNLGNLGVGSNYEGKCAATVLVWGAGIDKEEVGSSIKHESSPLMTGDSVQSSTLFLQKNVKLSVQENRLKLLGGELFNINMMNPRSSLKARLEDLQDNDFYLLRLRPIPKEGNNSGHALGLRKLPPENNDETPIFEILEPNAYEIEKYKGIENAINAILVKEGNYKNLQPESLEKYQVGTAHNEIKKLLSNKSKQKVENEGICTLQ